MTRRFELIPSQRSGVLPNQESASLEIRPAAPDDRDHLIRVFGQRDYFVDCFRRQRRRLGVLLVAWLEGVPVGGCFLRTEPADEAELREHLWGVPLLQHLEVLERRRNRGIGTRLVTAAERVLADQGFDRVALGVEMTNVDALRLYLRLGYRDWGHGTVECSCDLPPPGGRVTAAVETCHILVKSLVVES